MGGMVGGFGAGHDGTEGAGGVGVLGSFPMAAQLIGRLDFGQKTMLAVSGAKEQRWAADLQSKRLLQ
eukprot:m.28511 g.28511  ORF g.28511 m.28511 type:complete len:67 (+) comp4957_c0_seq2:205-405(+)